MGLQKLISFAALTASLLFVGTQDVQAEDTGPEYSSYVYFITPEPDAFYPEAPTGVDASIGVYQGQTANIATVELFVDGVSVGSVECATGCSFDDIQLDQGVHELVVVADTGSEDTRTVYVAAEPPDTDTGADETGTDTGVDETGDTGEDESGDDSQPGEDEGEGGGSAGSDDGAPEGGCEVTDKPGSPWGLLALPALLLVPAFRRRD